MREPLTSMASHNRLRTAFLVLILVLVFNLVPVLVFVLLLVPTSGSRFCCWCWRGWL